MKLLIVSVVMFLSHTCWAQKYISKEGSITFFSEAPLENIKATSKEASSLFDLASGEIVFSVPIKSFEFRKSLMQKHFNENYMDSDKYPKGTFKGKITNFQAVDGTYNAKATGTLTIKGETNKIDVDGEVMIKDQTVVIKAAFPVALKDYKIKIPKILFSNIAETVDVDVLFQYKPYVPN